VEQAMITANGRFEDEFFNIVYAEEALLRAEFDELITAAGFEEGRRSRLPRRPASHSH
jgi:hypothetical protein